jgi:hypothetical protein
MPGQPLGPTSNLKVGITSGSSSNLQFPISYFAMGNIKGKSSEHKPIREYSIVVSQDDIFLLNSGKRGQINV